MTTNEITVPVKLDAKTFKRFSRFDMLRLRKRWVRPVVFALILMAFAAVALLTGKEQAGMIAAVLLVVGLGLPLVYFGTFFSQVNMQAENQGLDQPRRVYTVRLSWEGVDVTNDRKQGEHVALKWSQLPAAYRVKGCVYLYASPARAYLLPDGQSDAPDEAVWACLSKHLGDRAKSLIR